MALEIRFRIFRMAPIYLKLNSDCELLPLEILDLQYMRPWDPCGQSRRWIQFPSFQGGKKQCWALWLADKENWIILPEPC